jgi:DNA replication protein DnaC
MIKGYHTSIMNMYEKIRREETKALENRKLEIQNQIPGVFDLESRIGKLCVDLTVSSFKVLENRDEHLRMLKEKITDLRMRKTELLVSHGYSPEYLALNYHCTKCKDTGYVGTEKCSCYKKKLVKIYYDNSDLKDLLKENNFDHFNMEFYPSRRVGEEHESPRKNMEKIVMKSMDFIKNFSSSDENLLFYGSSGTGKSFLSHCIAKELLDRGQFVVYRTAEELIQNLRSIRFENNTGLEEHILNCDLLIIDDLGTEQINDFSKTELFNLLNKRLLKRKKMIVSTNYALKELMTIYSERIYSRLFGNFNVCKFYGEDIRVTKNLKSIK